MAPATWCPHASNTAVQLGKLPAVTSKLLLAVDSLQAVSQFASCMVSLSEPIGPVLPTSYLASQGGRIGSCMELIFCACGSPLWSRSTASKEVLWSFHCDNVLCSNQIIKGALLFSLSCCLSQTDRHTHTSHLVCCSSRSCLPAHKHIVRHQPAWV